MGSGTKGQNAADFHFKKRFEIGGMMSEQEVRMNRELLKEIATAKKLGSQPRQDTANSHVI